eukprot:CCRYP_005153-RC/>CCRYP_005153-RC protein AED:0.37 eAED:0.37 QI:231/1/1/1/1/0.91/12/2182/791
MGAKYSKPCGAIADVKELEYISALHQTEFNELRKDGSIRAIDITSFLMSRYGIQVNEEEVKETILKDFGQCPRQNEETMTDADDGADHETESCDEQSHKAPMEHLDLTQVLALLLIPSLLKASGRLEEKNQNKVKDEADGTRTEGLKDEHNSENGLSQLCSSSYHTAMSNLETLEESTNINSTHKKINSRRWAILQSERGDKHSPDSDLIENVLGMILHDATGNIQPQPLTKELLRQLLNFYGEADMADDESLLEGMILEATNDTEGAPHDVEGDGVILDKDTFARALTKDVRLYPTDNENNITTNYYDVFKTFAPNGRKSKMPTSVEADADSDIRHVTSVFTFPSIDYTADTFRSKSFVILLWVTWILSYFAYLFNGQDNVLAFGVLHCEENMNNSFGCWVLQGIINWLLIMLELSVLGTTFVLWASAGNGAHHRINPLWVVIGMIAVVLFTIFPFFEEFKLSPSEDNVIISTEKDSSITQQMLYLLALLGGFMLLFVDLKNLIQTLVPRRVWEGYPILRKLLIAGTIQTEALGKKAASFKLNRLISNANSIHKNAMAGVAGESETTFGRAMLCFSKSSDRIEDVGGHMWTFRKLYNLELFAEEGVWFTTHLLAGNLAQITICLFLVSFFIYIFQSDLFQESMKYLPKDQQWRLQWSLIYGLIWGECATLLNAANYIPSTVRTILQFRSGAIDSLHDPKFLKLRLAVDQSSLLFGTIFWGTLYTAIVIGVCAMVFMAICLWPDFAQGVIIIWASFIGNAYCSLPSNHRLFFTFDCDNSFIQYSQGFSLPC